MRDAVRDWMTEPLSTLREFVAVWLLMVAIILAMNAIAGRSLLGLIGASIIGAVVFGIAACNRLRSAASQS